MTPTAFEHGPRLFLSPNSPWAGRWLKESESCESKPCAKEGSKVAIHLRSCDRDGVERTEIPVAMNVTPSFVGIAARNPRRIATMGRSFGLWRFLQKRHAIERTTTRRTVIGAQ